MHSDHSLEHLANFQHPPAIVARWLEFLSECEFTILYRAGRSHANAGNIPTPLIRRFNWPWSRWETEQEKDRDLAQVVSWLGMDSPPCPQDMVGSSPEVRILWKNHEMLVHHEGVLCRRWEDPCPSKPSILQVVVPRHLRSLVVQEYHDQGGGGGHTGSTRLQKKLTQQFHWVGMKKDVLDSVASCSSCSQLKRPVGRGSGAPPQSSWTGYPFERVAMDLIPNLPETAEGNRHILVVVDYCS